MIGKRFWPSRFFRVSKLQNREQDYLIFIMTVPVQKDDSISGCEALYSQPRDGKGVIGLGNSKAPNDT